MQNQEQAQGRLETLDYPPMNVQFSLEIKTATTKNKC